MPFTLFHHLISQWSSYKVKREKAVAENRHVRPPALLKMKALAGYLNKTVSTGGLLS